VPDRQIVSSATARKLFEHQLQEAKSRARLAANAKSAFLATMSREIRTPLSGVLE
jgi:signal transduction histidine kinase